MPLLSDNKSAPSEITSFASLNDVNKGDDIENLSVVLILPLGKDAVARNKIDQSICEKLLSFFRK